METAKNEVHMSKWKLVFLEIVFLVAKARYRRLAKTAANMFRSCLERKNYAARELPTHV